MRGLLFNPFIRKLIDLTGFKLPLELFFVARAVRFLCEDPVFTTGQIQTSYSQHPDVYEVTDVEFTGITYANEHDLFEDPYFLPTYILCSDENRAGLAAIMKSTETLRQWIYDNALWLIPLLAQIWQWLYSRGPASLSPAPFYV